MTITTAERIRDLVNCKEQLEGLLHITRNYDFQMRAEFHSAHNDNLSVGITKYYNLPIDIRDLIIERVKMEIDEIEAEISAIEVKSQLL